MNQRIAIFGDIGGHADHFAAQLEALGVDAARGIVPADLVVVQVGDLVDTGPDSVGVLELATRLLESSPDRYVQLVGNHELNHVRNEPTFLYRSDWQRLAEHDVHTLKALYARGAFRNAVALDVDELGPTLVTHAGLTSHVWKELGALVDVALVARLINGRDDLMDRTGLYRPGFRFTGRSVTFDVGPAWADAERELHASWHFHHGAGGAVPFSQVFGHTDLDDPTVEIGGRTFRTVDNGLGRDGGDRLRPMVVTGRVLGIEPRSADRSRPFP